jgi:hypothetical protein
VFDATGSGFWLQHSVPRWPADPGAPGFATLQHAQTVFAQHLACFTFGGPSAPAAARGLARLLAAAGPHFHAAALPASPAAAFPEWAALLAPPPPPPPPPAGAAGPLPAAAGPGPNATEAVEERGIVTEGGLALVAFAKPAALNASLTDAIVGPGLRLSAGRARAASMAAAAAAAARRRRRRWWRSEAAAAAQEEEDERARGAGPAASAGVGDGMLWETWRRTADALPSLCPPPPGPGAAAAAPPPAVNVAAVRFLGAGAPQWGWARDHSKWGVSASGGPAAAVCLCDQNRSAWQARRGGACACVQGRHDLWAAFWGAVEAVEPCAAAAAAAAAACGGGSAAGAGAATATVT